MLRGARGTSCRRTVDKIRAVLDEAERVRYCQRPHALSTSAQHVDVMWHCLLPATALALARCCYAAVLC